MKIFQHLYDPKGDVLYSDFPKEYNYLTQNLTAQNTVILLTNGLHSLKARLFVENNDYGTLMLLAAEEKYINSSKLFKELLGMTRVYMASMFRFKKKCIDDQNSYIEELIHNLTSLNSYNIQDLFALIPQQVLSNNINKQHDVIKEILTDKPNKAISTLLKAIKNCLAMKVEFSVFEKTVAVNPSLQKIRHSIRQLILSVLQIFIDDFDAKKITVKLASSEKELNVDYDTLMVSIYYLLENATKYCARNSEFSIIFKEEDTSFSIIFKMISVRIEEFEKEKLFENQFRGLNAISLTKKGAGIGMYRIGKTLKLNDAEIEIFPKVTSYQKEQNGILFEHNEFKIKFPGQQDWFNIS